MKINFVDNVACSVDNINPKPSWGFEFNEHGAYHFYDSPILAFHNSILMRSVGGR